MINKWENIDPGENFSCFECGSKLVKFYIYESSDGAYDDCHYRCENCGNDWWSESPDY